MPGIVDWDKKWAAVKTLTGRTQHSQVCSIIQADYDDAIPENIRRWRAPEGSTPVQLQFLRFFEHLAEYIGAQHRNPNRIFDCSYEEFLSDMAADKRRLVSRPPTRKGYVEFAVDLKSHPEKPHEEWFRSSVVDQRFMYLSRDAVDRWNDVIEGGRYATFEHCRSALRDFLRGSDWINYLRTNQPGSIVILGAGAPTKDVDIINSAIDTRVYSATQQLRVVVYDSSFYMLTDTVQHMHDHLRRERAGAKVEVVPCCADFMTLREGADRIRPSDDDRPVVFFILGGTIGNIREDRLIEAVRAVSRPGDMFVVSGEFAPDGDVAAFRDHLRDTYDHDRARNLAVGPIRPILDEAGLPTARHNELVRVKIGDGAHLPVELRTAIPKTMAVVFSVELPDTAGEHAGHEIHLVVAKKYNEVAFISYMQSRDFECVSPAYSCGESDYYRLLVFKRVEEAGDHSQARKES